MENDLNLIYSILFTEFEEVSGLYPVIDIPPVLSEDIKKLISNKCLSLLSGEKRIIPKSLAIIPFPSLNLKGLVKYIEWIDETQQNKLAQAAITILFKEADDLIFYKYIKNFETLLKEFSQKIIDLEKIKADKKEIISEMKDLHIDIKVILEDLRNKEIVIQQSEEFPEDESEVYDISEYVFKVIIAGEPQVGKTSITLRFTDKAFTRTYIPTLGVNITDKNIRAKDLIIKLLIWDIAGQSKFEKARKNFYRGAEGIILVFDLTNKKSLESINNWYQDIRKSLNNIHELVGFILGNKKDLEDERKIKEEEAEKLADKINFRYVETSALTGENIMFIFHKIGEILLSNRLNDQS